MKNKLRNKKGITLIALVITIIVLLILAGVSITMISSQDGILKKATSAKETQKKVSEEEKEKLAIQAVLIDGEGTIDLSKLTKDSDIVKAYTDKGYTYEGEGTFVSKDGKEAISITESGKIEKAVIPANFSYKEGTVNTGLVVENTNAGEFVWVPVKDALYDGTTTITVGTYTPMARKINNTENYQGVLYDLNQTKENQKVFDLSEYGVGKTKYREPSLVTGSDKDIFALLDTITGTYIDAQYYNSAGTYKDVKSFGRDMQDEYDNMVKSVIKYGGFYVGRYETGIKEGKAVSKDASKAENNTTTADASQTDTDMWYGLYNKQRTMAKDNGLDSVESSMIWGSQYDAMMIWMQETGTIIGTGYDTKKMNTKSITGNFSSDVINKVYDLYGCNMEWTLEATGESYRVSRGSYWDVDFIPAGEPSCRYTLDAFSSPLYIGSRLSLYIK